VPNDYTVTFRPLAGGNWRAEVDGTFPVVRFEADDLGDAVLAALQWAGPGKTVELRQVGAVP
jgi:hypothetical protein